MASNTAVVFSCAHSDPDVSNERFTWLGRWLYDIKPDYVVDLGDGADMRSLNSFDGRKPQAVVSQNYERDIDHYNDAMERMRHEFVRNRRKRPAYYGFEGNHEHRIKTAISFDPRLEGSKYGVSFKHLQTNKWFDEYHEYENGDPKVHRYDGVDFAHFITGGNMGRPVSGVHHAYALVQNRYNSCVVGHTHKRDIYFRDGVAGKAAIGLVAGSYKGAEESWAGQANKSWWKGAVVLHNIEDGYFEPQFVDLQTLSREYGGC